MASLNIDADDDDDNDDDNGNYTGDDGDDDEGNHDDDSDENLDDFERLIMTSATIPADVGHKYVNRYRFLAPVHNGRAYGLSPTEYTTKSTR